jgi:hypothetical protein
MSAARTSRFKDVFNDLNDLNGLNILNGIV